MRAAGRGERASGSGTSPGRVASRVGRRAGAPRSRGAPASVERLSARPPGPRAWARPDPQGAGRTGSLRSAPRPRAAFTNPLPGRRQGGRRVRPGRAGPLSGAGIEAPTELGLGGGPRAGFGHGGCALRVDSERRPPSSRPLTGLLRVRHSLGFGWQSGPLRSRSLCRDGGSLSPARVRFAVPRDGEAGPKRGDA